VKEHLRELVAQSLLDLRRHGKLPQDLAVPDYVIERTKSREHGDYATNIALLLAKAAGLPPRAPAARRKGLPHRLRQRTSVV
jgi:arginyl-tRNA synthetase